LAGVLAAELARAFEPDTEPVASNVSWLREKESAGRLQTDLLLIRQRAHGDRHLEMTMEGRRAYPRQLRKACKRRCSSRASQSSSGRRGCSFPPAGCGARRRGHERRPRVRCPHRCVHTAVACACLSDATSQRGLAEQATVFNVRRRPSYPCCRLPLPATIRTKRNEPGHPGAAGI
jgi:hypothetical protein